MRRSRYGGFRTSRSKKIRPLVRVKERTIKKGGKCAACKGRYEKGDRVTIVSVKRKVYHTATCVPANANTLAVFGGVGVATGPVTPTPESVVKALSATWSVGEAKLVAIEALENAMVVVAKNLPVTPEMEKAFDKYGKTKSVFLRPGSTQEGKQAARLSILEIVKTFF